MVEARQEDEVDDVLYPLVYFTMKVEQEAGRVWYIAVNKGKSIRMKNNARSDEPLAFRSFIDNVNVGL